MSEPHPSYLLTLVAGEFAEIDGLGEGRRPRACRVDLPRARGAARTTARRTFARTPEMVDALRRGHGRAVPLEQVRAGRRGRLHLRRDGEHHRHDDVRAHPARRARRHRRHVRRPHRPRARAPVVRRLRHVPRLVRGRGSTRASPRSSSTSGARSTSGATSTSYGLKGDLDAYLGEAHGRYRRADRLPGLRRAARSVRPPPLREGRPRPPHAPRRARRRALLARASARTSTRHARGVVETRDLQRAHGGGERPEPRALLRAVRSTSPGTPRSTSTSRGTRACSRSRRSRRRRRPTACPACFELPLDLDVGRRGRRTRRRAPRHARSSSRSPSRAPTRPAFVVVDPRDAHPRRGAPEGAGRHAARAARQGADGARALARGAGASPRVDDPPTIEALARALARRRRVLGHARRVRRGARADPRARVLRGARRRAARPRTPRCAARSSRRSARFRTPEALEAIKPLRAARRRATSSRREAARALGRTRQAAAFEILVDAARASELVRRRPRRRDRRPRRASRRARAAAPARRARATATRTRARRAAIMALPKLASDRKTREALEAAARRRRSRCCASTWSRALGELGDAKARPALRERLEVDLDPRVRRRIREVVRDLGRAAGAPADAPARRARQAAERARGAQGAPREARGAARRQRDAGVRSAGDARRHARRRKHGKKARTDES